MSELIRDTVFGHILRFITKGRVLQYAEEKDPSLWRQYLDRHQTKNTALYGRPDDETPEEKQGRDSGLASETQSNVNGNFSQDNGANLSDESSQTRGGDGGHQLSSSITGQRIDSEKGRDATIVTWFGENDPEVRTLEHRTQQKADAK